MSVNQRASTPPHQKPDETSGLKRIVGAAMVGTVVEW